jgi:RNA polymerase sigma-70 factor (ECF subfamily)
MSNRMNNKLHMLRTDDWLLVEQVCNGNREAFRNLVERYQQYAYQIAFRILKNHQDAEDVSQEAFVRIYQSIKSFRREAKFSTYLYRTVANLSLNVLRKKKRAPMDETADVESERQEDAALVVNPKSELMDLRSHLDRAIQRLSKRQQAIVVLRHYEGFSTREVSEIMNCSEGTVKQQLHRAMLKLEKFLAYLRD